MRHQTLTHRRLGPEGLAESQDLAEEFLGLARWFLTLAWRGGAVPVAAALVYDGSPHSLSTPPVGPRISHNPRQPEMGGAAGHPRAGRRPDQGCD